MAIDAQFIQDTIIQGAKIGIVSSILVWFTGWSLSHLIRHFKALTR